jgi:hypothetical protein
LDFDEPGETQNPNSSLHPHQTQSTLPNLNSDPNTIHQNPTQPDTPNPPSPQTVLPADLAATAREDIPLTSKAQEAADRMSDKARGAADRMTDKARGAAEGARRGQSGLHPSGAQVQMAR